MVSRKGGTGLFVSSKAPYEPLKPRAIQRMVRAISLRAGLDKRVHPHLLRHTFATLALNRYNGSVTSLRGDNSSIAAPNRSTRSGRPASSEGTSLRNNSVSTRPSSVGTTTRTRVNRRNDSGTIGSSSRSRISGSSSRQQLYAPSRSSNRSSIDNGNSRSYQSRSQNSYSPSRSTYAPSRSSGGSNRSGSFGGMFEIIAPY